MVSSNTVQSLSSIKSLLESRGLRPNKALGQNFLIEPAHIQRLIEAAGVHADDLVVEVGPGTGVLTDALLERGCTVVACELDRGLADVLRERLSDYARRGRFTLIEGDCLASKHEINAALLLALNGRPFKLVANLPYGAASPLIIALATRHSECLGQFVTIQREVADRLRAKPGTRDYGEMGVLVQAMCEVKRIALLPPGCFWPPPKVESEMVAIVPRATAMTADPGALSRLCRVLFTHRRKQLGAILAKELGARVDLPADLDATARPESLTIEQLIRLAEQLGV